MKAQDIPDYVRYWVDNNNLTIINAQYKRKKTKRHHMYMGGVEFDIQMDGVDAIFTEICTLCAGDALGLGETVPPWMIKGPMAKILREMAIEAAEITKEQWRKTNGKNVEKAAAARRKQIAEQKAKYGKALPTGRGKEKWAEIVEED